MEADPSTHLMRPCRITITFHVQIEGNTIRLSASAVPRRTVVY